MEFIEYSGKTVEEAIANAAIDLETVTDNIDYKIIEKGSDGLLSLFNKKGARILARKKESSLTVEDKARDFLNKIFDAMGLPVEMNIEYDDIDSQLNINITGEDVGLLIGKRGQTLDSLQYIVSLMINKTEERYVKVKVDTEDYRQRRKSTLESLAKNIAFKVKRSRRPMALEPMNPYERRIIHAALQNDRYVTTKSEGEEPYRHVVVSMKPMNNRFYASSPSRYSTSGGRYSSSRNYNSSYNAGYNNRYNNHYNNDERYNNDENYNNSDERYSSENSSSRYNNERYSNNRYNSNRYGRYNSRYNSNYKRSYDANSNQADMGNENLDIPSNDDMGGSEE